MAVVLLSTLAFGAVNAQNQCTLEGKIVLKYDHN